MLDCGHCACFLTVTVAIVSRPRQKGVPARGRDGTGDDAGRGVGAFVSRIHYAVAIGILGQRAALGIHPIAGRRARALIEVVHHAVMIGILRQAATGGIDRVPRRGGGTGVDRVLHSVPVTVAIAVGAEEQRQAGLAGQMEV